MTTRTLCYIRHPLRLSSVSQTFTSRLFPLNRPSILQEFTTGFKMHFSHSKFVFALLPLIHAQDPTFATLTPAITACPTVTTTVGAPLCLTTIHYPPASPITTIARPRCIGLPCVKTETVTVPCGCGGVAPTSTLTLNCSAPCKFTICLSGCLFVGRCGGFAMLTFISRSIWMQSDNLQDCATYHEMSSRTNVY